MRYPTVDRSSATEYINGRRSGSIGPRSAPAVIWIGAGVDFENVAESAVDDLLEAWQSADKTNMNRGQDKDQLEGDLAVDLYKSLKPLPVDVLTDRGFWRYLSVTLFDFVQWRDGETCQLVSFGAGEGSSGKWDCVPFRMFDRAMIAEAGSDDAADPFWGSRIAGTDLWRSHILRVLIGNAPVLVNEILRDSSAGRLPTDKLRPFIKGLQRTRSNVLFELLDKEQARDAVDRERGRTISALDVVGSDG